MVSCWLLLRCSVVFVGRRVVESLIMIGRDRGRQMEESAEFQTL
jgi:hypothetical protein